MVVQERSLSSLMAPSLATCAPARCEERYTVSQMKQQGEEKRPPGQAAAGHRHTAPDRGEERTIDRASIGNQTTEMRLMVATNQPDDNSLNPDALGGIDDNRLIVLIGRLQTDLRLLVVDLFDSGLVIIDESDDGLAVSGALGLFDDDDVTFSYLIIAHGVTTHPKGEALGSAEVRGDSDGFASEDGLDRIAGGDDTEERDLIIFIETIAGGTGIASGGIGIGIGGLRSSRQDLDAAPLVLLATDKPLALECGEVLVNGRRRTEVEFGLNLGDRRREAVGLVKSDQKVV